MTAILTSVAQVRTSLASMVHMACGKVCTTVHVVAPQRPAQAYTVEIPAQYRRQVYQFLAQHLELRQRLRDSELLRLTYAEAAQAVRLACAAAEEAAAEEYRRARSEAG